MLWPIWSLANCVETGLLHKVQSPFLKSSCMAVWSRPLLGRKHVLMCSLGPKSSSPSAMPRAMTLTVKQELAILGSLRVWQQLLMSFRTFMFTTRYILSLAITREGGVASFVQTPAIGDLLSQASLSFERAVWLIWLIFTAVTPGTRQMEGFHTWWS